jgi:hypothetical protein
MLERGLAQAVGGGDHRQLSPTLGVAGLDPQDGGTGEDFLEVRVLVAWQHKVVLSEVFASR